MPTSALNHRGLTRVLETRRSCRCCLLLQLQLAPEIHGAVRVAVRGRAHLPSGKPARLREALRTHEALSPWAQQRAGTAAHPCLGLSPSSSPPRTSAPSSQRDLPLPRSLLAPTHLLFSEPHFTDSKHCSTKGGYFFLPRLSGVRPSLKAGFCCFLSFHLSAPGLLGPQLALSWYILLISSTRGLVGDSGLVPSECEEEEGRN